MLRRIEAHVAPGAIIAANDSEVAENAYALADAKAGVPFVDDTPAASWLAREVRQ